MPSAPDRFDFEHIIEVFNRHRVDYIVIGGMAAVLQGSPTNTIDVDALVRDDQQNFERLGAALHGKHSGPWAWCCGG